MPSVDKDLQEKLNFQRLLWQRGFFSIADVPIINYREDAGELKKDEVTDADVVGFFYDETLGTVFLISKKPIFKEKITDLTLDNKTVKFWRVNDYVSQLEPEDLNSFLKVTTEKQTLASISNIKFKIKKLKGE